MTMGSRRGQVSLHAVMNVVSSVLLLAAVGRLLFVIRKPPFDKTDVHKTKTTTPAASQWMLLQQQQQQLQQQQQDQWTAQRKKPHTLTRGGRGSEAAPMSAEQLELPLAVDSLDRQFDLTAASSGGYKTAQDRREEEGEGDEEGALAWGARLKGRVLIFTMDSLQDRVALAARGGPAGEIKVRESLTASLLEAGVEVGL